MCIRYNNTPTHLTILVHSIIRSFLNSTRVRQVFVSRLTHVKQRSYYSASSLSILSGHALGLVPNVPQSNAGLCLSGSQTLRHCVPRRQQVLVVSWCCWLARFASNLTNLMRHQASALRNLFSRHRAQSLGLWIPFGSDTLGYVPMLTVLGLCFLQAVRLQDQVTNCSSESFSSVCQMSA